MGAEDNSLSAPPGDYGRKAKTQRNWRGPAQAVEHVVQVDATRRTSPGLDMQEVGSGNVDNLSSQEPAQVLHGCRQLVS